MLRLEVVPSLLIRSQRTNRLTFGTSRFEASTCQLPLASSCPLSSPCCSHCLTPFSVRYVILANSLTEKDFSAFGDCAAAGFLGAAALGVAAASLFGGAVAFFAGAAALFFAAAVFFAGAAAFFFGAAAFFAGAAALFFGAAAFFAGALAFLGLAVAFFALAAPFVFGFLVGFFCSFFAIVD